MTKTAQISKEKRQFIITLRHEGQSIRKRTLKVSSSAVSKTIKRYDETLSSGPPQERKTELPLLQRTNSLEITAPQIAAQIKVTDTSQHQLFRGDCVNQAFMVELLQRNHY